MAGPPPSGNGTIDVKPSDLFRVSTGIATQQGPYNQAARDLLTDLETYPDAGGYGTAPQAFATAYVKVGNRFLEVWAKSVVSLGGAAVGFTSTANNYARAEAAAHPSGKRQATTQPLPAVIDKAPDYGRVPNLKWGDDDGGDDIVRSLMEWVPGPVRDILRPLVKHAFRMGRVADVYPYPQQHYLNALSQSWMSMTVGLSMTESSLTGLVGSITQQSNSEWHEAMRHFCSSLWGTTAWGRSTAGYQWKHDSASSQTASHPVMTVLFDTAQTVSDLLYEFAEAAVYLNHEVYEVYKQAIRDTLPSIDVNFKDGVDAKDVAGIFKGVAKGIMKGASQLGQGIVLNMNTGKLNSIVDAYDSRVNALVPKLNALMGPLDEAHMSAPAYNAEVARAEAFGARSLNEFRPQPRWTDPEDTPNGVYRIDLASHEYLLGGHHRLVAGPAACPGRRSAESLRKPGTER
ncbi:hypothetical protein [Streptomyces sp. NPDC056244]|uniref:hypothetical protein n=1 Tax=Streptomyces sp. NPDC056244 TaxID=3345762 RepID=UPI0035D6C4FA